MIGIHENGELRALNNGYTLGTSGGGGTAIPTADTNAKFDADAHMNSTDMTTGADSELEDFIEGLNVQSGGAQLTRVTCTNNSKLTYGNCYGWYDPLTKSVRLSFTWSANQNMLASDVMFTIPEGFRPIENTGFPQTTVTNDNNFNCYAGIAYTNGQIKCEGTNYGRRGWGYIEYRCWKRGD